MRRPGRQLPRWLRPERANQGEPGLQGEREVFRHEAQLVAHRVPARVARDRARPSRRAETGRLLDRPGREVVRFQLVVMGVPDHGPREQERGEQPTALHVGKPPFRLVSRARLDSLAQDGATSVAGALAASYLKPARAAPRQPKMYEKPSARKEAPWAGSPLSRGLAAGAVAGCR